MFLIFRLYGKFCWPPTAQFHNDDETSRQSGIVELHAVPSQQDATKHIALLRWFPTDRQADPSPPDPTKATDHLFDLTPQGAVDWFSTNTRNDCAIWLDSSGAAAAGADQAFVMFRGAFLFEQYRRPKDDKAAGSADLEVQWPLMRCFTYADNPVFSSLGIYGKTHPLLHLGLHLPLPVRRTSLPTASRKNAGAFPFSAVFDLKPKATDDWFKIDRLFAGWKANDGLPKFDVPEKTCFPFRGENKPNKDNMRLGSFGFAEYGKTDSNFAVYGLDRPTSLTYWPLNSQTLRQDILWPYGFALDYNEDDWLQSANIGLADSSLRFYSAAKETGVDRGHSSSLTYRASVIRTGVNNPNSGDLRGDTKGLRLRLARELGGRLADGIHYGADETANEEEASKVDGWIRIGARHLSVDCELAWEIARRDIWTTDPDSDWSPTVSIRLHWLEPISAHNVNAAPVNANTEFRSGLLAHANHSLATVRDSLERGEAGRPHSFLPDLSGPDGSPSIRFCLYGSPLPASFKDGMVSWGRPAPGAGQGGWRRPSMRLSIANPDHLIGGTNESTLKNFELKLSATGLTFFQPKPEAPPPELEFTLEHDKDWPPQATDSVEDGEPFFASFRVTTRPLLQQEQGSWQGRLSSLQFRGSKNYPTTIEFGHFRIGGRGAHLGLGDGAPLLLYPEGRIATEISLAIPASTIEPIGVDTARTDRSGRPGPLLIPLDAATTDSDGANVFWLKATETLSPTHDRKLVASIIENSPQIGTRSYVVLSSEPFSIFRYTHQPLYARGTVETANVAFYSDDDRIWQYRRTSDLYHYVFPPQVVGESADKPRRLELHDLPESDPNNENPPTPFVPHQDNNGKNVLDAHNFRTAGPNSDLQRRAVEFRLTPSAEMWIQPSDVQRGYFMPEATSYEIFRQRGEYGLGAALGYLRAEFLYGLPVGIDVGKERSIARGARVAEIEALTGKPTGSAQPGSEARVSSRWNALRSAIARRPERLEIWARDLDSAVDFTPARFTDGVQFALRHTALHRPPQIDLKPNSGVGETIDDYKSLPRVGGIDADKVLDEAKNNPRHHPQGLSGGALWPVEQLNLFKTLLQVPQSVGGTIEAIALSPTGGDARQKAQFLDGRVTIISETYNGYVQRQQVEVLGRICAFWHRAKHVVVYERTVNPSAQFAPKFGDDKQRTRSRRPILRKVREYIELLQPERSYPDFTIAEQRTAGFLERVRFNSKIINVDSAWARDIENYGWEIPLWNRQSARERPQVYPMPDIAFVSTAEGDAEKPVVAQECLDPDYLYFYADVSPNASSDTDTWKPRLNLDFPNMPAAHDIAEEVDRKSSDQPEISEHENRRPPVSRILPGLRRFTWRLAPAAQKVAVNAGRAGKPVYAGLDSVSFMRATHARPKELKESAPTLSKVLGIVGGLAGKPESEALAALKYWGADGQNAGSDGAKAFSASISALNAALGAGNLGALNDARKKLDAAWKGSLKSDLKKLIPGDVGKFKDFVSELKATPALCERLKSDAVETIQRKELLVRTALHDWSAQFDEILKKLDPYRTTSKKEVIDQLTDKAVAYIHPLFAEASQDVARLQEGVEKSSAIVADIKAEIEAVVARARQRIAQFVNGYDQNKPWSEERRRSFRAGLTAAVSSVGGDIVAAIEEARQRLGVELNEVSQAIGGHIAKALGQLTVLQAGALGEVTEVHRHVDQLLGKIDKVLEGFVNASGTGQLDDVLTKIKNSGVSAGLKTRAETAITSLKTAVAKAKAAAGEARTQAAALDQRADQAASQVTDLITAVGTAIKEIGTSLSTELGELNQVAIELTNEAATDLSKEVSGLLDSVNEEIADVIAWPQKWLVKIGTQIDAVVTPAAAFLDSILLDARAELSAIPAAALPVIDDAKALLQSVQDALAPDALLEGFVKDEIIRATLDQLFLSLPETIKDIPEADKAITEAVAAMRSQLDLFVDKVGDLMRTLRNDALTGMEQVSAACGQVAEGIAEVEKYFQTIGSDAATYFENKLKDAYAALEKNPTFQNLQQDLANFPTDAKQLLAAAQSFDRSVRGLQNDLSRAHESARAYGDRVFDQFSKLDDGGLLAAPNNVLKLYSAVTGAPELAALKADIDRIRSDFDEIDNVIKTTKANALFNRLSDELKALGLSLPFDKISDQLLPADLSNFDIGNVFRNFGGAKLSNLLKDYKIPEGVSNAVRVTHDFDKKQARAWVQVDIDAPMGGRRSLFSVGVFKADFVDMRLTGQVRFEASKDQDKVSETGFGRVGTTIDLVVGGQSMVQFEKFGLSFTREKGLDVEFDPKNIRLNPTFKFIQDFLSALFPDDIGGLAVIKENGIPVGLQHDFAIPPMALNFGTSGVSNICIANHFKLLAFPDFMLANRFNLSSVERPFIFSIFIIGGTGYIQIDAEYRPFDNELMVCVEAGAGGSASLAFAFGPFSGQVFITLSGTLAYRKVIGRPGGGLSISAVLVIAGHVNVAGIVTVGIVLMLRMTYRDNGQIDADGTLTVEIRISKFFKITARAQAKYKLRGGKSETTVSTSVSGQVTDERLNKLQKAAEKLEAARH
ncbi:hypothetical protein IVA93_33975 [Bradyrhizobium sp. 155]|uniref:hypothetical protein n=1 Tax=Bradyrhizobium sp. 155 TaxID=2782629 RepID=UPI001FFEDEC0|nr:hypothetical protein [Bradyrhizobium sp. 155]UPK11133.1 hypothetical protein IVA93_33975 [Bradyrhizobium sp. 155]